MHRFAHAFPGLFFFVFTRFSHPIFPQDLDQLRRLMEPVVMHLEALTAAPSLAGSSRRDAASLQLLVRRTKEYLSML